MPRAPAANTTKATIKNVFFTFSPFSTSANKLAFDVRYCYIHSILCECKDFVKKRIRSEKDRLFEDENLSAQISSGPIGSIRLKLQMCCTRAAWKQAHVPTLSRRW